jgi:hypothetical protein
MLRLIDQMSLTIFVIVALTLGLSPFFPEPHILEKLKMLAAGTLVRPVDMLDLALHGLPWGLLALKLARMAMQRRGG